MVTEKRALLDHAHRCRCIASEVEHTPAAERLKTMATDYEQRAAALSSGSTSKAAALLPLEQPQQSI
jgi:hypothetical protein